MIGVELGVRDLAICVDIGLLVNAPDALQRADVERILRAQVAGVGGINLAAGFIVQLLLFKRLGLGLGQNAAVLGDLGFKGNPPEKQWCSAVEFSRQDI